MSPASPSSPSSSPPVPPESSTESSSLPPVHPPDRLHYSRRDPAVAPSGPVFSLTSPTADPDTEVPYHSYYLRDHSTLLPPDHYTSTSISVVVESGTYREAVQSPEWRTAMATELDALARTQT